MMSAKQNQRTPNRTHLRRADGLSLIRFEFLKIVRKRSTLTIMAVSLLLTAFLFGLPVIQYQIYDQNGVMKGTKGISYDREQYADLSVPLTEEYITKTIREVQGLFEDPANVGYDGNERFLTGNAYWNEIAPRENFLNLIARTYAAPNESRGYNSFPDLDASDGADFYQAVQAKREAILNEPGRALSNEQKAYWSGMAGKIDTPLQYGYYEGWEVIISSFGLLLFAVLAICIVIAPVFSGEYQAGTDAVILSAKYGRTKLITAKIIASLLFGTIAFALHMVTACAIPLAAFGVSGWNLPMQIANTAIPYPLTFLQGTMRNIGILYLVLLGMIGLTLFLSSRMKSPYLVLIVLVPVLFIPMLLSPNGTAGAYNLMLFLLPYQAVMPEFGKYISYQAGGLAFDAFSARAILYAAFTAVMLLLARGGFQRHETAG